jgi:hypothetical protein
MRQTFLFMFLVVLGLNSCKRHPVTRGDISIEANKFAHSFAERNGVDSSLLRTFGVKQSIEMGELEAKYVIPALFLDFDSIAKSSFDNFKRAIDSSKTDKYLVIYTRGDSPVSEWFFSSNEQELAAKSWFDNLIARSAPINPFMGVACDNSILNAPSPKQATLHVAGFPDIIVTHGMETDILMVFDGESFNRFRIFSYKNELFVVSDNRTGVANEVLTGIKLSEFHLAVASGKGL